MKKVSLEKKAGVEQCCKQATQKDTQLSRFNGSYPPVAGLSAHRLPRRTIANSPTSLQFFFPFFLFFWGLVLSLSAPLCWLIQLVICMYINSLTVS